MSGKDRANICKTPDTAHHQRTIRCAYCVHIVCIYCICMYIYIYVYIIDEHILYICLIMFRVCLHVCLCSVYIRFASKAEVELKRICKKRNAATTNSYFFHLNWISDFHLDFCSIISRLFKPHLFKSLLRLTKRNDKHFQLFCNLACFVRLGSRHQLLPCVV